MKKCKFATLLLVTCRFSICLAQADKQVETASTLFNISESYIYNTHTVYLQNSNKMIIEMADVTDYLLIRNLDSLATMVMDDVSFYKDSLTALENVRIDYAIKLESENTMIRFKKYAPDGDIYVKRHGELLKMKTERDTVRLIVRKQLIEHNSSMHLYDFPIQVTFILNNYQELGDILKEKGELNHIVDTLISKTFPSVYSPNLANHQTMAQYWPYRRIDNFRIKYLEPAESHIDKRRKRSPCN